MKKSFDKIMQGYREFREKYADGNESVMQQLADYGQKPEIMFVSCCDSRVDPALILQCNPGDLFIARNVANIVPPFEADQRHHGTSAALEFGVCYLNVKHLIIMGHSQCGGINGLLNKESLKDQDDFLSNWVTLINKTDDKIEVDEFAKQALLQSHENCLTFPWIKKRVDTNELKIHLWFFDIKTGRIQAYSFENKTFEVLTRDSLGF